MTVAIHQPNLFPWIGFFDKMRLADVLILLDTVPFTKGGFQNRVKLAGPRGAQWLTVPVQTKGHMGQRTCDVAMADASRLAHTHLSTFTALYRKAPGYQRLWGRMEELYRKTDGSLVEFTIPGIMMIRHLLGVTTEVVRASDLSAAGSRDELLCALVREVRGTTYLSGPSGRGYLDEGVFRAQGVDVRYHSFYPFSYPQVCGAFLGGLSAIDYLFCDPYLNEWREHIVSQTLP